MAHHSRSPLLGTALATGLVSTLLAAFAGLAAFTAPKASLARNRHLALASIEPGKVNIGAAQDLAEAQQLPDDPMLPCDAECLALTESCVEEGCSVDAMMKLDAKLASSEEQVEASLAAVKAAQKTNLVRSESQRARMENILQRLGTLRGQLVGLKSFEDSNLVQQMIKAAAVAFGAGRPNDYPKVGVASYSA